MFIICSTLALTTSRARDHACLNRDGAPLMRFFLPFALFDCYRLEDNHMTVAVLAVVTHPPVLADTAAAAVLARAALPPVRGSQMLLPPHSLQRLRCRPWSQ